MERTGVLGIEIEFNLKFKRAFFGHIVLFRPALRAFHPRSSIESHYWRSNKNTVTKREYFQYLTYTYFTTGTFFTKMKLFSRRKSHFSGSISPETNVFVWEKYIIMLNLLKEILFNGFGSLLRCFFISQLPINNYNWKMSICIYNFITAICKHDSARTFNV